MDLPSKKNKSVYNVPEEMAPDRANFVTYAGEFWEKQGDGTWEQIDEASIPAGSDVFQIATTDIAKSAVIEGDEEDDDIEDDGLTKTGVGNIPGVVGAESQEGLGPDTTKLPHAGEEHGED